MVEHKWIVDNDLMDNEDPGYSIIHYKIIRY